MKERERKSKTKGDGWSKWEAFTQFVHSRHWEFLSFILYSEFKRNI